MTFDELEAVLVSRRGQDPDSSYTAALLGNPERISRKVMEEAFEVCLEFGRSEQSAERIAEESADLLYHLMVGLVQAEVPFADVVRVLEERRS